MTCKANQWTGFYMIRTSVMKELNKKRVEKWIALFPFCLQQSFHATVLFLYVPPVKIRKPEVNLQFTIHSFGKYWQFYKEHFDRHGDQKL